MKIKIFSSKIELGKHAAKEGAKKIKLAIKKNGSANIILATGASQFEMLDQLVKENLDWTRVICFHLDEYIGISESHHASFRKYLRERFADKVKVKQFYFINGEVDPNLECKRINSIIANYNIDVAFIGIGENGHLAFNDPPADFETTQPYIIVNLDEECRRQQFNEGWFENFENVPRKAISMSIKQILKSNSIICTVPDNRKANAVFNTFNQAVSPFYPSTILNEHKDTIMFLDNESAKLLKK